MKLVIVESPTKARTLSRFLGEDYRIEATYGHLRDLPKKNLGVDVEAGFEPEYVVVKGREKRIRELENLAKKADEVVLATDPDREGEAIAWHTALLISEKLGKPNKSTRIVFHEITKSALKKAIANPGDINMSLVYAQQARRMLDRLVGYKLSPILWKKVRRGLSAGRVQSVAVRLIVEKEKEREAFEPEEYWDIFVTLKSKLKTQNSKRKKPLPIAHNSLLFDVKLERINGEKVKVGSKKEAAKVITDLKAADYRVDSVEKKKAERSPYPPFTTSTLQQTAARYMGWSGKKTMMHAQRLYERGLITYHRTDSLNISKQALLDVRKFIKEKYGDKYLPKRERFYKTKSKSAQEAHEAIRPTEMEMRKGNGEMRNENGKREKLGRDDGRLYDLIWRRFVASQMSEAVFDRTKIEVKAQKSKLKPEYLLTARGEILRFDGWMKVFGRRKEDIFLPEVEEKERLKFVDLDAEQKFTKPPARYSEAMLIKTLEKEGIGRPSTYAMIISTIQDRHYVERDEDKRFYPTKLGVAVNNFLVGNFSEVMDIKFTAGMEDNLDNIAKGKKDWKKVLAEFYSPFEQKLKKVEKTADRVKIPVDKLKEECPDCKKGELVVRIGKFGKFIACNRFPKCKYSRNYVEKAGLTCPECGGDIVVKRTKKGKRFYGCSNYPDCKFAAWKKEKIEQSL